MAIVTNSGSVLNINSDNLTYGELKALLPTTGAVRVPGRKQLMEMGLPSILNADTGGSRLNVFPNGFYIYEAGGRFTVFAVDRCVKFLLRLSKGTVSEAAYMDMEWPIPLMEAGSHRLAHNEDSRFRYHARFSIDAVDMDHSKFLSDSNSPDVKFPMMDDEFEKKELLENAKKKLTLRQLQIIELRFQEDMKQKDIASMLGITQQAVSRILRQAVARLRKNLRKIFSGI